jgi:hypothetical protein
MGQHKRSGVLAQYLASDEAQRSPDCHAELALIERHAPRRSVRSYALLHRILAASDEAQLDAIQALLDADGEPADVCNAT